MSSPEQNSNVWRDFAKINKQTDLILKKNHVKHVNSIKELDIVRSLIQKYFREFRPIIRGVNLDSQLMDGHFEVLQELCSTRSLRSLYFLTFKKIAKTFSELEIQNEYAFSNFNSSFRMTELEGKINQTLSKLDKNIGNSYFQLIKDINDTSMTSFRGTAHELREILREVLAILAPDEEIIKSHGFTLELNTKKPSMKQKVIFILSLRREQNETDQIIIEKSISLIETAEDIIGGLARNIYTSGSESAHTNKAIRNKIIKLKMYLDAVLSDILEINI